MKRETRAIVTRVLRAYMLALQARFRARARRPGIRSYLRKNPPCHGCAFNRATLGWHGEEATANSLRQAIAEQRPFFCHEGFPWKTPPTRWAPKTLQRFLLKRKFCRGWFAVVGTRGLETMFERCAVDVMKTEPDRV